MPQKINPEAVWKSDLEVPRDGEGVDAADVALPVSDLLGNAKYLLRVVNDLSAQVEDLQRSRGGFNLSTQSAASIEPANATALKVMLARYEGFTAPVHLEVSGLPAGVTGTLSENDTVGESVNLVLTATDAVAAGTYTVTLTGTSGTRTAVASTNLTVTPQSVRPTFSIQSPHTIGIERAYGDNALGGFGFTRIGGFDGTITWSAPNLPSGLTAVFGTTSSPPVYINYPVAGGGAPIAGVEERGTVTMDLTAGPGLPAGTYNIQIRGTSGTLVVSQGVAVRVTGHAEAAGDFRLALAYDAGDQSGTNGATVTIERLNGFTGPVTLTPGMLAPVVLYGITFVTPLVLINGQPGAVTVVSNTARVTATGTGRAWVNSGVADPASQSPAYQLGVHYGETLITGAAVVAGTQITRTVPVRVRYGTKVY
ncbi:COG1470 family protein [Deinococcus arenicola]|uniref:Uncharacterized protein n=1 Tax=Deinococcus arenicola TaxID=2994950 RepID=A0ABU4DV87_9DEIO|nr:hypothetical protein [Deinococcus sp. ZS9-10]MDV6376359.1 hypothetical protein [Deinococcus sp. ZS9-10]